MFYFHNLDLNVNVYDYWGFILGIGQMNLVWLLLLLLRPWMGYDYTIIQVVCWVRAPERRRLCPIVVKIWIPIKHNSVVSGHPKSTRILQVECLSTGPPGFGHHILVSKLRYTNT